MASQTFSLSGAGNQDSATLTVAAGEKVRVRVTSITGRPNLQLKVTANATSNFIPIDDPHAWVSTGVLGSDVVLVRMVGTKPTDAITGIIESGA